MEVERTKEIEWREIERLEREVEREEALELCPECGSPRLILDYRRGEFVCQDCGLVLEDTYIDAGPEWRAFDSEQKEKRSRAGAPVTYAFHDKGLSTIISYNNKDFHGKSISVRNRAWFFRLRRWQKRIRISNASERNLTFALSEIDRMVSALGLPRSIKEIASIIYRKALEKNLIKGRSIEGVAAASLYAACREAKIPRTLDEIAAFSKIKKKEIGRTYRYLIREMGLKLMPVSPLEYISRFCGMLNLSRDVQKKAIEIIKKAEERELVSGKGPAGVAAAAIYIASILYGERRTQKKVAEIAGVTEVTVRNRYRELSEKLAIEILL
ncbi:MAG: transcription initiation factor IIB [Archaeoglobus sp.]|nr:transcription initiation factor IIB [Archaeoglobus sp.]